MYYIHHVANPHRAMQADILHTMINKRNLYKFKSSIAGQREMSQT